MILLRYGLLSEAMNDKFSSAKAVQRFFFDFIFVFLLLCFLVDYSFGFLTEFWLNFLVYFLLVLFFFFFRLAFFDKNTLIKLHKVTKKVRILCNGAAKILIKFIHRRDVKFGQKSTLYVRALLQVLKFLQKFSLSVPTHSFLLFLLLVLEKLRRKMHMLISFSVFYDKNLDLLFES